MNKTETAQAWDGLLSFIAQEEDLDDEGVLRELRSSGVDVDTFMARIGHEVRTGIQVQHRKQAQEERAIVEQKLQEVRQKVLRFPVAEIRQLAKNAELGKFGPAGQDLAIACRNKQDREPTEAELRTLVEDILLTTDIKPDA